MLDPDLIRRLPVLTCTDHSSHSRVARASNRTGILPYRVEKDRTLPPQSSILIDSQSYENLRFAVNIMILPTFYISFI